MVRQEENVMRAERDEDEYRPRQRRKETSLIAQIAAGVFIGQLAFWSVEQALEYFYGKWQIGQIKIELQQWERSGHQGLPFEK